MAAHFFLRYTVINSTKGAGMRILMVLWVVFVLTSPWIVHWMIQAADLKVKIEAPADETRAIGIVIDRLYNAADGCTC